MLRQEGHPQLKCYSAVCLFYFSLPVTRQRLYFGRIRTRLRVDHFQTFRLFFDFLPLNLLLVRSHQAEIIVVMRLSNIIWRFGEGVANSSYNFYSGWKSLICSSFCSIYSICEGKGLVENVIWGRGLETNVRIPSCWGRRSKIAQKPLYDIWTFPYPRTHQNVR